MIDVSCMFVDALYQVEEVLPVSVFPRAFTGMCVEFCQNVSESCLKSRPGDTLGNMGSTRLWASPVRGSCFLPSPQVAVQCTSSCGRDRVE